jgi:hypothetical protein
MLAATISAEEVEKTFRNGLLLAEVGRSGETPRRTARESLVNDRVSKSSSAKDDDSPSSQFHSARPSKRSSIESSIGAGEKLKLRGLFLRAFLHLSN